MKDIGSLTAMAVCTAALLLACGEETTSTSGAPDTSATSSSSTAGGAGGSSTASGTGGSSTTSGTGGEGGAGGESTATAGGGGASSDASAFCSDFEKTCGFGDGFYQDMEDCVEDFEQKYSEKRRACVKMHLGLAKGGTGAAKTHCPHAAGGAPCDKN